MKTMTLPDFLTEAEINEAIAMYRADSSVGFSCRVRDAIIAPNMERINKALGQENDADYLAYCVEYVLSQISK